MSPELLQIIVQLGSTGVAVWFLQQVWTELKVQNERIYELLKRQDEAEKFRLSNSPATPFVPQKPPD